MFRHMDWWFFPSATDQGLRLMSGFGYLHWTDVFPAAVLSVWCTFWPHLTTTGAPLNHAAVSCSNLFGCSDWTQNTSLLMLDYWITFFPADQEHRLFFHYFKSDAGLYLEVLYLYNRLIGSGQHITMTLSLCGPYFLRYPSAFIFSMTTSNQKKILTHSYAFPNPFILSWNSKWDILRNVNTAHIHTMNKLYNTATRKLGI